MPPYLDTQMEPRDEALTRSSFKYPPIPPSLPSIHPFLLLLLLCLFCAIVLEFLSRFLSLLPFFYHFSSFICFFFLNKLKGFKKASMGDTLCVVWPWLLFVSEDLCHIVLTAGQYMRIKNWNTVSNKTTLRFMAAKNLKVQVFGRLMGRMEIIIDYI